MITFPVLIFVILAIVFLSVVTVQQGTIAVITMFGKYQRILQPGLNFKIPIVEMVFKKISIQNQSIELQFQAITVDQANVYFKAMLLYAVINQDEKTIKDVAFKFVNEQNLMQALIRTVEGSIRGSVATKRQSEVLSL
jgi:regulator of protease activity HflC (stomatin/prohibitin superfamily)